MRAWYGMSTYIPWPKQVYSQALSQWGGKYTSPTGKNGKDKEGTDNCENLLSWGDRILRVENIMQDLMQNLNLRVENIINQ